MKEKIKKVFENGRGAIIALFLLQLFLMFFVTPNKYDDAKFLESITGTSIISYIGPRYFNWTSRFLIEYSLCGVLKISKYLWILIECFMVALAGYSISRIFVKDNKKENNIMLLFMILAYSITTMNGAGWAATTVNYMWPLATGLFALIPIKKIWNGEKISLIEYLLYSLALIFSGNQEQTCCILLGTYLLFTILMIIKNKKIHPYMIIQTILIIASLIFILTCPGNYVRNQQEIQNIFKDFGMLNIFDKIALGFTSTMGLIIKDGNTIFLLLSLIIAVYIFTNYKETLYRIVAIIPLLSIILLSFAKSEITAIFPFFGQFRNLLITEQVMLNPSNLDNLLSILPFVFAVANFICIIMSIILIFKNLKNNIALLVFLVGLASKLIIGFSPTVFSSNGRTMIFFEFSMIIVSILIWQEFRKNKNEKVKNVTGCLIKSIGVLQYINSLLCILLTQK